MNNSLLCLDATPSFLGIFDFSVAPALLFYAYIPVIIVVLAMSILIVRKDGFSLKSTPLFVLGVSFSIWVLNIIIQWVAVHASVVYFAWQVTALIEILIPVSTLFLVYVFMGNRDLTFWMKLFFTLMILITAVATPSILNMNGFDIYNCQGQVGPLLHYIYAFEILAALWILFFGLRKYFRLKKVAVVFNGERKQILFITISSSIFLLIFALSNIIGEVTQTYEINLYGPIGMVIFIGFLTFMIVKFKTFNIKLLATQALVWGMTFLIGTQFFFIQVTTNFILNGFTFIASLFFGQLLIQSVKNEVSQREMLQRINLELEGLIQQRESLVHLITHKVKGSFTRSKYLFSEMLQGTFGALSPELTKMTERGLESDVEGIATVDLVLNASNLQKGTVKYDLKPTDFKKILNDVLLEKKGPAENKGLKLNVDIEEDKGEYNISGDAFWLKEVVLNLVQNAIVYTPKGDVNVTLKKVAGAGGTPGKMLFTVQDTGIGISEEDKKNLFTEGGRGKESIKVNVDSTGYGLYTVKLIVDAHKGRIWVESEGKDKGSTFFVELGLIS